MACQTHVDLQQRSVAQRVDTRRWLGLAVALFATFMVYLDTSIVNVSAPSLEKDLHVSFAEVQLVIAGYTLAYAVLLATGGRLGDLYGRKRLFLLGISGFTLSSALCGITPTGPLLILFRVLQGAMGALMIPQVISLIQVSFPPEERSLAFSCYTVTIGLAFLLGQIVGGVLLTLNILGLGWRSIFLVNVPFGIIALVAAFPLIHESRASLTRSLRLDLRGVLFLSLALFLLIFPLVEGENAGWPLWALCCLVLAVPCCALFVFWEQRLARQGGAPLVPLFLFQSRSFVAGILTILLGNLLFGATLLLIAFYLQTGLRYSSLQAGLVVMVIGLAFMLASSTTPTMLRWLGNRALHVAAALITLGYLLIGLSAYLFVPAYGIVPLLGALFVEGWGNGILLAPLMNKALEGIDTSVAGAASGVYSTVQQGANALGVAIIGLVFAVLLASGTRVIGAFLMSLLVIMVGSLGLSLTVRLFPKKVVVSSQESPASQMEKLM